ncbi:MAG: TonB-dependent receptor [Verrucomicrobia bacterium]|nr:TonB-dependent receptor [Verrucomicrobiota bacterium]
MSTFRSLLLLSSCAALPADAQTAAAPATEINRLDQFVVSAGPDPKTSFDLAQGTSVLAGEDLRRLAQATLGETLASIPGVSAASYGPGASRPVIRGLGGDRVRVLDNGIGALDASSISPDHNTALEPLFATRIEVLRGPSALRYGSSAVGGAVNVIDNTIPDTAPDGHARGAAEARFGGAARERTGVVSVGHGADGLAFRVNALRQQTADVRIPGVARIDADAPAGQPRDTLPGSATETTSLGGGFTKFWKSGHAGASVTRYETNYGVPTGDEPAISIDLRQTRFDLEAESTQAFGPFRGLQLHSSFGDYRHAELSGGSTVNTTFTNRAWEGRLELPHASVGALSGSVGLQGTFSDFAAVGEEVATPPSLTRNTAIFAVEDYQASDVLTFQFGGRLEHQAIKLGEVEAGLPAVPGYSARSDQRKNFAGASASAGLVFRPAKDWSVGLALAYTERLPTAQELFSNGPHGGTGAYEVGTSGLSNERSLGFDLSLRRRAGFVTGSVGVFANRFSGYIFEEELPESVVPAAHNQARLTPYQFVARDADFRGAELELVFHLLESGPRHLHLETTADVVRAHERTSGTPLPRIPPVRYGGRLSYGDAAWRLGVEARRTQSQSHLATAESATPGHTLVNANVAYLIAAGRVSYELFLRGQNLGDVIAREHTSFLKEFAPLAGRGVTLGVRLTF